MPGEVFVHRNISNQVINTDINLMCVLQYAIDFLRVKHIIVCGHYNCGGIEAVLENQTSGLLDHWLENVKDLMERNGTPGLDEMCELNVRLQVRNLALNTIVRRAWSQGHPLFLHGWIYSYPTVCSVTWGSAETDSKTRLKNSPDPLCGVQVENQAGKTAPGLILLVSEPC